MLVTLWGVGISEELGSLWLEHLEDEGKIMAAGQPQARLCSGVTMRSHFLAHRVREGGGNLHFLGTKCP